MNRLLLAAAIALPLGFVVASQEDHRSCRRPTARIAAEATALSAAARHPAERRRAAVDDDATRAVRAVANQIAEQYRLGHRDEGDRLASMDPRVFRFDDENAPSLSATYRANPARRGGGFMELCVWRSAGQEGPLAVAVAPGSYGSTVPGVQDLTVLRAPVLVLPTGESYVTAQVPVACASFGSDSPRHGMSYALKRFEPGSEIDRLMVALCAGDEANEADAQLAVWVARNDITKQDLAAKPRVITFGSGMRIGPGNSDGAGRLLRLASVETGALRFFQEARPDFNRYRRAPPAPEVELEVAPADQPAPPEAVADPS